LFSLRGVAFPPILITVTTMTTTSVLSLSFALGTTFFWGIGCGTNSVPNPVEVELNRIPDKLKTDDHPIEVSTPLRKETEKKHNKPEATHDTSEKTQPLTKNLVQKEDGMYYLHGADNPFTGVALILNEDGKPHYKGQIDNGYRVGRGVAWNKAGNKRYEGEWKRIHKYPGSRLFTGKVYYYYGGTDTLKLQGAYLEGQLISGQNFDRNGLNY